MSKKDNLLKFWESLESHQQTKDVIKPFRNQSQSLKMKSNSHSDLLCGRPSIVPSKAQLQGWKGVTGSVDTVTNPGVDDNQGGYDDSVAENDKAEVGSLPVIPRHEILSHTTKGRARRCRTHPARQKKIANKVPSVEVTTIVDVQMSPNPYQTPPAATNEFSNFKHSPTSASFLDKSPLPELAAASPKPATSLVKPSSSFSTFLSNPLKFTKAQETKSKKELPTVPKRNFIPSSPKVSPRHKVGTGCTDSGQLIPGSPFHESSSSKTPSKSPSISSKNFNGQRSSSLKSVATSNADITDRRASLKAVSTPYKSLQAAVTPLKPEPASLQPIKSPRIARLTANFQADKSSPANKTAAVRAINLEADARGQEPGLSSSVNSSQLKTGKSAVTPSQAVAPVSVEEGVVGNIDKEQELLVKEGRSLRSIIGTENQDLNVYVNLINKKVNDLESIVTEEKLARIELEKEVAELKLIVTKLSLAH